jgi:NTP pyrophosphatase (non-canonical NTP hydrolase)
MESFNLYVKLMEECGEVVRAASKVLKRGRHGVEKQHLSEEIGDVVAVIELLQQRGLIDNPSMKRKQLRTLSKYSNYFDENGECGKNS